MTLKIQEIVSVIVPVCNTEKYVRKCLLSIINQTYQNLEIILIDDGSTDQSKLICDRFKKKDSRVRVMHIQKSGVSKARNIGIQASKGKYICFVDSDDWLSKTAIEKMVYRMEVEEADFCYGNYVRLELISNRREIISVKKTFCELDNRKEFLDILKQMGFGPCWKLYISEIIKQNSIFFPLNQQLGEDQIFNLEYLHFCDKIVIEKSIIYYYNRLNVISTTRQMHSDINLWSLNKAKAYEDYFGKGSKECYIQEYLVNKFFDSCYNACNHYIIFEKTMGEEYVNKKIIETVLMFEKHFQCNTWKNVSQTKNRKIIEEYLKENDIESLKNQLKERNYEVNLEGWKQPIISLIRWAKYVYYYRISIRIYDYQNLGLDSKRK